MEKVKQLEDWTGKTGWLVVAATIGALISRLWDALQFEKKFLTRTELQSILNEFETTRLGEVRRDISRLQVQGNEVLAEIKALSRNIIRLETRIEARNKRDTDE